jgi:hypothetical protein
MYTRFAGLLLIESIIEATKVTLSFLGRYNPTNCKIKLAIDWNLIPVSLSTILPLLTANVDSAFAMAPHGESITLKCVSTNGNSLAN